VYRLLQAAVGRAGDGAGLLKPLDGERLLRSDP
jgi:hypothetical protein